MTAVERNADGLRTARLWDGSTWWVFLECSGLELLQLAGRELPQAQHAAAIAAMSVLGDDGKRLNPNPQAALQWFARQPMGKLAGLVLDGGNLVNAPEGPVDPEG